jgi:hypothetical protein
MKLIKLVPLLAIIALITPLSPVASNGCSQYGTFAVEDYLTGRCKCMNGYIMTERIGGSYCKSGNDICHEKHGFSSKYNSLNESCECFYGYFMGRDSIGREGQCISCSETLGSYSRYDSISGTCECYDGYVLGKDSIGRIRCVSLDSKCADRLGYDAKYDLVSGMCNCRSGYMIKDGKCTYGSTWCHLNQGYYSTYNESKKACECLIGYTLDSSHKCAEKQNNVYFLLKEVDTGDKSAIIVSDYDHRYYLITYGIGCYGSSFERYLGKKLVINLGTDYSVDVSDKIVLQADDETCSIMSKEAASSSSTLIKEDLPSVPSGVSNKRDIVTNGSGESTKNIYTGTTEEENGISAFTVVFLIALGGGFVWLIWKAMRNSVKK